MARKNGSHQARSSHFWGQQTIWARRKRKDGLRIWGRREGKGIPGAAGHVRVFGFSVCSRKGMACLKMATGISQAVHLKQPSPSRVFPIKSHQWYSWMSPVTKLTGKAFHWRHSHVTTYHRTFSGQQSWLTMLSCFRSSSSKGPFLSLAEDTAYLPAELPH